MEEAAAITLSPTGWQLPELDARYQPPSTLHLVRARLESP